MYHPKFPSHRDFLKQAASASLAAGGSFVMTRRPRIEISALSVAQGNVLVRVPDVTRGLWKKLKPLAVVR